MNGFKNDMDDEKSLKGKGATEHSNKTPEMQPERFLAMQINNNAKTYSLITQLNHTTQSHNSITDANDTFKTCLQITP
ncbi:hypothetical protein A2F76_001925 [Escherichia coli]|nr:hypothetical protein [Escherichia coli]